MTDFTKLREALTFMACDRTDAECATIEAAARLVPMLVAALRPFALDAPNQERECEEIGWSRFGPLQAGSPVTLDDYLRARAAIAQAEGGER
jgi:hypothetical protein